MPKAVEIYTDGACSGNPGVGGWGAILSHRGKEMSISGVYDHTTNNRMEMTAVIEALSKLKEPCVVNVYSDSAYVVNAFLKGWVYSWEKNDWKSSGGAIKNIELWQKLLELVAQHSVTFVKVKGHSDNEYNNKCDILARGEVDRYLASHKQDN